MSETEIIDYKNLPMHDFENDETISQKRKEACKVDYVDMKLHHIDKIYTSCFVYDKKTGLPIARKPRSTHELIFNLLKSCQAMTVEIQEQHKRYAELLIHTKKRDETLNQLRDTVDQILKTLGESK